MAINCGPGLATQALRSKTIKLLKLLVNDSEEVLTLTLILTLTLTLIGGHSLQIGYYQLGKNSWSPQL